MSNTLLLLMAGLLLMSVIQSGNKRRTFYAVYSGGLILLLGLVVWAFISQDYSLAWVAKYSDASLSMPLRIAAVWAGQEGTLLLWLLTLCVISWLIKRERVGTVVLLQQFLLFIGFLLLNPLAKSGLTHGLGLNPLLQTTWMLVHPPVVFIGYALLSVPFAEALVGEEHLGKAYLQLAVITLGLGLALGGAWAYRVLGWGGFWAWDPVEASSLVPWLLALVAWHTYGRSGARRASLWCYVAVLWAIAITRSGVLAKSSVHAFAGSNTGLYLFGLFFVHLAAVIFVLYRNRSNSQPQVLVWQAVSIYALWVAVGTAVPIVSELVFDLPIGVGVGFYRSGAIPAVAIVLWSLRHSLLRDGTARGLAHFGVVLFLIGAVASAAFSDSRTAALENGALVESGQLALRYSRTSGGGEIAVFSGDDSFLAFTPLRHAEVAEPLIWRQLWRDVYVAPLSVGDRGGIEITLSRGQVQSWQGLELTLLGLLEGARQEGHTIVAEVLAGHTVVAPAMRITDTGIQGRKAVLPGGGAAALVAVHPDSSQVTLRIYSAEETEGLLMAEVTVKPLMNFVRLGVIMALAGAALAFIEK